MVAVPCDPQDVTPQWLTEALHPLLSDGTAVTELSWDTIGQEWGFTGVVARIWPRPSGGGIPPSLVAKFPTARRTTASSYQQRQTKDEATWLRAYERSAREVLFYHQVVQHGRVPAPRLYFGAADADSRCIILLLEDLGRGRVGDVLHGCSASQAELILRSVAPFHALWWQNPALDTLAWLPRWGTDLATRARRYAQSVEPFLARFGERLPPRAEPLVRALAGSLMTLLSELVDAPTTIIHGDLHLDNVVFGPADIDPCVWIIDWQGVMLGPAVLDLGVATAIEGDAGGSSVSGILQDYHATLVDWGVIGYPEDLFERHVHISLLAALAGTVNWLATADLGSLVGRERVIVDSIIEESRILRVILGRHVDRLLGI